MNWLESTKTFIVVAKEQSFAKAARSLNLNPAIVTKHIQWLEAQLKTTLFLRTTRKVTLTDDGEYFLNRSTPLLDEIEDLSLTMIDRSKVLEGKLTIASTPYIGSSNPVIHWLVSFLKEYPNITLDLQLIVSPVNMLSSNIDILIARETFLLDDSEAIARQLLTYQNNCYAAPAYLKSHEEPIKPEHLQQHNCLVYLNSNWEFDCGVYSISGNFICNTASGIFAAACAGLGIIQAPSFIADDLVEKGLLTRILTDCTRKNKTLNFYYPKLNYRPQKITAIINWLSSSHI